MDDQKQKWVFVTLAGLLFILWFTGYVASFWAGLGMIVLLATLAAIQKLERLRGFATLIFIAWIILFLVVPQLFRTFPLTEEGLETQKRVTDLRRAEELHVPGDRALRALRFWCNDVENSIVKEITLQYRSEKGNLQKIVDSFIKSTSALEIARDKIMRDRILVLQKYRDECTQFILDNSKAKTVPSFALWQIAAIFLVVAFVASYAIRGAAKDEDTKNIAGFFEVTFQFALIAGLLSWLAFGGLVALLQWFALLPLVAKIGILIFAFYAGTKGTQYERVRWLGFLVQVLTVGFGIAYLIYWAVYTPDPTAALNLKMTDFLKMFGW